MSAAGAAAYIAWSVPTPAGFIFAVGLPLLLLRFPVTGIVLVALAAQEIGSNGRYGVLTTLGNGAYLGHGKIPVIVALAVVAACAAIAQSWPQRGMTVRPLDAVVFASAAGLVVLTVGVGLANGQSAFSALNQNARPFVLLLLGLLIGVSLRRLPAEHKRLVFVTGGVLVALCAAAAVAIPLGESADSRLSRYFIFYDAALPAVAAAVFIAVLVSPKWRWDWRHVAVIIAMPLLVLVSFRRSVWVAGLFALAVTAVCCWPQLRQLAGRFAFASLVTLLVVFASPGFAADLGIRSGDSLDVADSPPVFVDPRTVTPTPAVTTPAPASTAKPQPTEPAATASTPKVNSAELRAESASGHLDDLRLGWRYAMDNFWTGVGPSAPQLPGMAAKTATRVYVHNELLQGWLRFGPIAPFLVISFLTAAGFLAMGALRNRQSSIITRAAAVFCLIAPLCLMTAPFLSGTSRWPLLMGIAAGLVALQSGREPSPAPQPATSEVAA